MGESRVARGPGGNAPGQASGPGERCARAMLELLEETAFEAQRLQRTRQEMLDVLAELELENARLVAEHGKLRRSELAARISAHEKDLLIRSIHGWIETNLQVISGLLAVQGRYLRDAATRQLFSDSRTRVKAIALVHEQFHQSSTLPHVDFDRYVEALVESLLDLYEGARVRVTSDLDVAGVRLPIEVAIPCGLLINEIVTNSLEHGFPGERRGVIRVSLRPVEPGRYHLSVSDDGVGLPPELDPHNPRSLGFDLIDTLAQHLDAAVEVKSTRGTAFEVHFSARA